MYYKSVYRNTRTAKGLEIELPAADGGKRDNRGGARTSRSFLHFGKYNCMQFKFFVLLK